MAPRAVSENLPGDGPHYCVAWPAERAIRAAISAATLLRRVVTVRPRLDQRRVAFSARAPAYLRLSGPHQALKERALLLRSESASADLPARDNYFSHRLVPARMNCAGR